MSHKKILLLFSTNRGCKASTKDAEDPVSWYHYTLHYVGIGNDELRDKYIELAIQQGMPDDSLIFFRSVQKRLDLLPEEIKRREIKRLEHQKMWFSLGRLYRELEEYQLATQATCKGVIESIDEGNVFTAAFHLGGICITPRNGALGFT